MPATPPDAHRFETRAIHAGQDPDPTTGAVVVPIHPTTTYAQPELGVNKGFEYSRSGNPTRKALEECIASLEGGAQGLAFASGSAALATIAALLKGGDHVVAEENVYGGTVRYWNNIGIANGATITFVDASDPENVRKAMTDRTKMVLVETPTNPNLKLNDIAAIAAVAHERGALCVVDNTFASPYLQQPLALGADIVYHSATKYLGGHSDSVSGLLVAKDKAVGDRLKFLQNAIGAVLSPFDSYLVLRGIKTLAIRMERQSETALRIAQWLERHPKVAKVNYPFLESHPQVALAKRQMKLGSGMLSFELHGGLDAGRRFMNAIQLWTLAESLGAVESLVCHPATMTHASIPVEQRRRSGLTDGLVRLSCGLEHPDDLLADLEQALEKA